MSLSELFQSARKASATRVAENIKTFLEGTPKGQKPDHNGAISAAVIAELTQLAAGAAVLEAQLSQVRKDMAQTTVAIGQVIAFIQSQKAAPPASPPPPAPVVIQKPDSEKDIAAVTRTA